MQYSTVPAPWGVVSRLIAVITNTYLVENVACQSPFGICRLAFADLGFLGGAILRFELVTQLVQPAFRCLVHEMQVEQERLEDDKVDEIARPGRTPGYNENAHGDCKDHHSNRGG